MSSISLNDLLNKYGDVAIENRPLYMDEGDIKSLISLSKFIKPKTVIEIGVQRGQTSKCILDNNPQIERYIGIDIPYGTQTTLSVQSGEVPQVAGEVAGEDERFEVIIRPNGSRDLSENDLPKADMILIDGDHSYEGVLNDVELSSKLINDGGVICWHDYGNTLVHGATRVIDELRSNGANIIHIEGTMVCFQLK